MRENPSPYRRIHDQINDKSFQRPDIIAPGPDPIPLAESLILLRLVNSCPYRSKDAACGCSGHRCAIRTTSPIVSHLDCLECMRIHGSA